jgi:PhnB protein
MQSKVNPIPAGYHTVTPFLSIKDAEKAIRFYQKAFNAKEIELHKTPEGKVMHAVIQIGNSRLMIADEFPNSGCGMASPASLKSTTVGLHLYVEDVDSFFNQAVKAGATVSMPVTDMFWGDRYGQLQDPYGHRWSVSTHKFDPTPEQIEQGSKECMKKSACTAS